MNRYQVTARVARFAAGVLDLSEAQAATRAHNLQPLGDGRWRIVRPVEFIAGEVIGYDGDMPRALADLLDEPVAAPAEPVAGAAKPARAARRPRKEPAA